MSAPSAAPSSLAKAAPSSLANPAPSKAASSATKAAPSSSQATQAKRNPDPPKPVPSQAASTKPETPPENKVAPNESKAVMINEKNPSTKESTSAVTAPPPLLGPDGKEVPRPADNDGKPLPCYLNKDGKAILDKDGSPIPIEYDDNGKPIPLKVIKSPKAAKTKAEKTRRERLREYDVQALGCVVCVGFLDFLSCLAVASYFVHVVVHAYKKNEHPVLSLLTFILLLVSAFTAFMTCIAVKWKSVITIWLWSTFTIPAFICSIILTCLMPKFVNTTVFVAFIFMMIRMIFLLCTSCMTTSAIAHNHEEPTQNEPVVVTSTYGSQSRNVVIAQPSYGYRQYYSPSGDVVIVGVGHSNYYYDGYGDGYYM